jgi:pyruvate formate lyase activating enzyme
MAIRATDVTLESSSRATKRAEPERQEGWVFDIKRYAVHDGPGVRTAVFLKGCSLSCVWCHNPESIHPQPEICVYPQRCIGCRACVEVCPNNVHQLGDNGEHMLERERCTLCGKCTEACYAEALVMVGKRMTVEEVVEVLREDRAFYEASQGGVTLTGGEPFLQGRFAAMLLKACKAEGLHTAVDTSGHISWAVIEESLPYIDLVLYDLKHPHPQQHKQYTGATNELALEHLRLLSQVGVPIEIRIPVIPTVNDSPELMAAIGRFIAPLNNIVAVRLLPYHRLAGSKYAGIGRSNTMPQVDTPTKEDLERAADCLQTDQPLPITIS